MDKRKQALPKREKKTGIQNQKGGEEDDRRIHRSKSKRKV